MLDVQLVGRDVAARYIQVFALDNLGTMTSITRVSSSAPPIGYPLPAEGDTSGGGRYLGCVCAHTGPLAIGKRCFIEFPSMKKELKEEGVGSSGLITIRSV